MKKILYTATTEIHLLNFHLPYLQWLKSQGFEVHVAYNGVNPIPFADKTWEISFGRSPFKSDNLLALKRLRKIINENNYSIIHCHTPMGGAVTRLAAIGARRKGTKVLYTAHGFHFYKGAPLKNWAIFFTMEWLLSFFTDSIITINKMDHDYLTSKSFASAGKYMINGIGLDPSRLKLIDSDKKESLRETLGYNSKDFLILYIAEFIPRKNHKFVLTAIPELLRSCPDVKFLFAGGGVLRDAMIQLSDELEITDQVEFLGFRKDIGNFISVADIGISSSKHEGLGLGVAEMMYNSLPVVISEDKGHNELVDHGKNGFVFRQGNQSEFVNYVRKLYSDPKLRLEIGNRGKKSMEKFMISNSLNQMIEIYHKHI